MENMELIEKLGKCAAACETCLDACLDENDVKKMVECVRLDRDCAKLCHLTASFVASNSPYASQMVDVCEELCRECAEECEMHQMDHCQECAAACRECEEACKTYSSISA